MPLVSAASREQCRPRKAEDLTVTKCHSCKVESELVLLVDVVMVEVTGIVTVKVKRAKIVCHCFSFFLSVISIM